MVRAYREMAYIIAFWKLNYCNMASRTEVEHCMPWHYVRTECFKNGGSILLGSYTYA
jgi:hypothetical protein